MLRELLLTVAALGGVVCIVLTILAFTGGYSLIMFKTGSMSPTIPAGSVSLVQRIPAAEIEVGDVVTVDREGKLPITHRVTAIEPGATAAERVITMKGDANSTADPEPYTITEGGVVRGSVPNLAYVIVWFGSPWVLGGITIGAALLVMWAFWPRTSPQFRSAEPTPAFTTRRERRLGHSLIIATIAAATGASVLLPAPPAEAASLVSIVTNTDRGGVHSLDPVRPFNWDIDIDAAAAPADGNLDVTLSASGQQMQITTDVRACTVPWQESGCDGLESPLSAAAVRPLDGSEQKLLERPTPSTVHLRVAVTGSGTDDGEATLTLRATAAQTTVSTDLGGTTLPATGGASLGLMAAPAAVLVGLGIVMIVRTRKRGS